MKLELKQEDLEGCAIIFDHIREVFKSIKDVDEQLAETFEAHIHQTLERLEQNLFDNNQQNDTQQSQQILISKLELYSICENHFQQFLNLVDPRICKIFQMISEFQQRNIQDQQLILQFADKEKQQLLKKQQIFYEKDKKHLQNQLQDQNQGYFQQKNIIQDLQQNNKQKDEIINQQHQEIEKLQNLIRNLEKEARFNLQQLSQYQNQTVKSKTNEVRKQIYKRNIRVLNHHETLNLVHEIFQDKQNNFETLEKFSYHFFLKKYGTKNLVIEWINILEDSVQEWSHQNKLIDIFHKTYRNECSEAFLQQSFSVQSEIKKLRDQYRRNNQIQSSENLMQDEVQYILHFLFKQEAENLIERYLSQEQNNHSLQNIILEQRFEDFSLRVNNFINAYKTVDQDGDGIIDYSQFKQLLDVIQEESSFQRHINQLDPLCKNQILFSPCLEYFEGETQNDIFYIELFK